MRLQRFQATAIVMVFATFSTLPLPLMRRRPATSAWQKLNPNTREIFDISMKSMDSAWDPEAHLVRLPDAFSGHIETGRRNRYMVRETSNYALGLLMRDGKGDRARAVEGLDAVLKEQFLDKAKPWYGTFRRTPEEPEPSGAATVMWTQLRSQLARLYRHHLRDDPYRVSRSDFRRSRAKCTLPSIARS